MLDQPYLLVMTLPCYVDAQGRRSLEALWHQDLVEHLEQIGDLTLAAPAIVGEPPPKSVPIDHSAYKGKLKHLDLPPNGTTRTALMGLPRTLGLLWKAIGRSSIVHANAGGYPFSLG